MESWLRKMESRNCTTETRSSLETVTFSIADLGAFRPHLVSLGG
jgi:hypothetical protein